MLLVGTSGGRLDVHGVACQPLVQPLGNLHFGGLCVGAAVHFRDDFGQCQPNLLLCFAIDGFADQLPGFWLIAQSVFSLPSAVCSFANGTAAVCFLCCHNFLTFRMLLAISAHSFYRIYHNPGLEKMQFYPPYPSTWACLSSHWKNSSRRTSRRLSSFNVGKSSLWKSW